MKAFLCGAALAMSLTPALAESGFMNGTTLLKYCEGNDNFKAVCEGYLQGVSDTQDYVGEFMQSTKINKSCVPAGTKPETLRKIFVKMGHLGLHNEQPASSLAIVAFTAAWHCTQNAKYKDAYETLGKALR